MSGDQKLLRFVNCNIIRDHKIIREDIWVRGGRIVNPEKVFYEEQIKEDLRIDCKNRLIAPGFIEIQINGGYGFDFSYEDNTEEGLNTVANKLLEHGVTAFCPTVVTSPVEIYHKILPKLHYRPGNAKGATILGAHVEGPFINTEKKGAHPQECIIDYEQGIEQVESTYGSLENIRIVTLAPELLNSSSVIKKLKEKNIVVSLGHSTADLNTSEDALLNGASLITHLFNAMLPFHHRDPGLVGLLASDKISEKNSIYFGIIADGIHTHPSALRIAYRVHPEGLILVTDAISALGLHTGKHKIGQLDIEIKNNKAFIANTNTLCGSIATMIECVRNFILATGCPAEYALEAASLHPAQVLGIQDQKGTLNFGADADFIILTDDYEIASTWINGECVYELQHLFSNIDIGQGSDLPNSDTSNVIQRDSVTKNGNFNLIPNVLSNVANKSDSEVLHSGSNKQISKLHTENDDSSDLQRSLSSKTNSKIQQCSVASGNYSDLSHSVLNVANKSNSNL